VLSIIICVGPAREGTQILSYVIYHLSNMEKTIGVAKMIRCTVGIINSVPYCVLHKCYTLMRQKFKSLKGQ
jgi:hypothetical protein